MPPSYQNEGTFTPDNLFAGDYPRAMDTVTLLTGQSYPRGAVLGKIDTGGKYTLSLAAAEDGSEDPCAVLAEAVDATSADKKAAVYLTGEFNQDALTFGAGHSKTTAATRDALRAFGIFLKSIIPA